METWYRTNVVRSRDRSLSLSLSMLKVWVLVKRKSRNFLPSLFFPPFNLFLINTSSHFSLWGRKTWRERERERPRCVNCRFQWRLWESNENLIPYLSLQTKLYISPCLHLDLEVEVHSVPISIPASHLFSSRPIIEVSIDPSPDGSHSYKRFIGLQSVEWLKGARARLEKSTAF